MTSIGWKPASVTRFAEVAPAVGRHSFRDERGRFRKATAAEGYAQDIGEAQSLTASRGERFGVFRGRLSDRAFAIREGAAVPLDSERIRAVVNATAEGAVQILFDRLIVTSPVATGLLRSQWRATPLGVTNNTPYVGQTEYVNRSSRGYIRRAVSYTLHRVNIPREARTGGVITPGQRTNIIRL